MADALEHRVLFLPGQAVDRDERVTVLGDDPHPAGTAHWPPYDSGSLSATSAPSILRG